VNAERVAEILNRITNASIGVIGDFCIDAYWQLLEGEPELSLETGKPTFAVAQQRYSLGGAGNVVSNIAALGVRRVHAMGVLGNDIFGQEVLRQCEALDVDCQSVVQQPADWQTSVYAKPYRGSEEQNRIDFGRHNHLSEESESKLISALSQNILKLDALVVNQQLPKSLFSPAVIDTLNMLARKHPKKVFLVDSRHRIPEFHSMICKLNAIEAARLFGKTIGKNEEAEKSELCEYAQRLFNQSGKPVFITRGGLGILFFDEKGATEIPAIKAKEPIDTVGAGDTVVAAIVSALAAGVSPSDAAFFAMVAASVTIRKLHQTGTSTPQEILTFARVLSNPLK
jgi:rfaE bifunctional protein kinase chain/domain